MLFPQMDGVLLRPFFLSGWVMLPVHRASIQLENGIGRHCAFVPGAWQVLAGVQGLDGTCHDQKGMNNNHYHQRFKILVSLPIPDIVGDQDRCNKSVLPVYQAPATLPFNKGSVTMQTATTSQLLALNPRPGNVLRQTKPQHPQQICSCGVRTQPLSPIPAPSPFVHLGNCSV